MKRGKWREEELRRDSGMVGKINQRVGGDAKV